MRDILTPAQAAIYLGCSIYTLRNWRNNKTGPKYIKPNSKTVRYRLSDLNAWLDEKTVTP